MEDKKKRRNTAKQKNTVKRKRKRRNQQKTDVISITILIVAVCVFVFSLYQLAMLLVPYYFGGQEYDEVKKLVITTEKTAEGEEKFQVDFEALQEENSDTVAWIRFDEPAVISYPVVKGMDNDLYLTKTFSASDNKLRDFHGLPECIFIFRQKYDHLRAQSESGRRDVFTAECIW